VRAAPAAFVVGNVRGHGAASLLHTNSASDNGDVGTLIGLGSWWASHQIADHLNIAVHVYPLAFDFGNTDTVTKIGVGEFGIHLLF
jgi:hypothetical protein